MIARRAGRPAAIARAAAKVWSSLRNGNLNCAQRVSYQCFANEGDFHGKVSAAIGPSEQRKVRSPSGAASQRRVSDPRALTEAEVERLIGAAKTNRHGHRDATMILIAFRHGLRAAELVDLRWDQIDFGKPAVLHVRRLKNGTPATHPLSGRELRDLRRLQRESAASDYVFVTERGAPFAVRLPGHGGTCR